MSSILMESRKYGPGFVLVHQEMKQIKSRDIDVAGSLIANPQVRVCFRLGDEDARKLAKGFSYFEEKDLKNLGAGEAICRLEKSEYDFNLKVPKPEVTREDSESPLNRIRQRTRAMYATPRTVMEEQLSKEHTSLFDEDEALKAKSKSNSGEKGQPKSPDPAKKESHQPEPSKKGELKSEASDPEINQNVSDTLSGQSPHSEKPQEEKTQAPTSESKAPPKHEEIKEYLITEAEKLNYKVDREVWVLHGKGRVDLVFTRGKLKIACEIANTTTDKHEVGNITKCIKAGFTQITVVSAMPERLKRICELFRQTVNNIKPDVYFKSPEAFVEILGRFAMSDPAGGEIEKSKPNKLKVDFKGSEESGEEKKRKQKELIEQLKINLKKKP